MRFLLGLYTFLPPPQNWADSVAAYRLTEDTERMAKTQPNDRSAPVFRRPIAQGKPCAIYTRQSRTAGSSLASNDVPHGVCQDFAWGRGGDGDGLLTQVPCGYRDLRQNAERGNLSALLFTNGSRNRSRGSRRIEKAPR